MGKKNSSTPSANKAATPDGKPAPTPSDARYYLGRGGIVHEVGTGIISIFTGPQAGRQIGDAIGAGQEAGLTAIENKDNE